MLPAKLKKSNLFNDANSYFGQTGEVTLPKLTRKMEAWRGGGMDGEVDIDMGQDKIELEWKLGGMDLTVLRQYGQTNAAGTLLRFMGAYQRDDGGANHAVEVVVRGRHSEIDPGSAKDGDDTETTVKTSCTYYKLVVDGRTEIEIDLLNAVFVVDGIDRLAEQRAAIGLI